MKFKKHFIIYLVIISFFTSFTWISRGVGDPRLASPDIEWGVTEGATYTWVVRESNTSLGFLPVGSKYTITIDAIISSGGGAASQIDVTMTRYNSQTEITTTILNTEMFIYFDSAIDYVSLYSCFYDHGFFAPITDHDGFADGFWDYFRDTCSYTSGSWGSYEDRLFYIRGKFNNLYYDWEFNADSITNKLTVYYDSEDYNAGIFQYRIELEALIPYGNFFLIFSGLTIVSLIYIYRKKIK